MSFYTLSDGRKVQEPHPLKAEGAAPGSGKKRKAKREKKIPDFRSGLQFGWWLVRELGCAVEFDGGGVAEGVEDAEY